MKPNDLLITFASWEDRFRWGFDRNIKRLGTCKVLVFYFTAYAERTLENRDAISNICKINAIDHTSVELDIDDPAFNWRNTNSAIKKTCDDCHNIVVDISTMPREIIWYVLWIAEHRHIPTQYAYYSPEEYGRNWLSREPRTPRLVYKLSGLALPSARTTLVVIAGFDLQRVKRLINWYEPAKLIIGIQKSNTFRQNDRRMSEYRDVLGKEHDCKIFELDAFSEKRGMNSILGAVPEVGQQHNWSHNIIMSSLGPKLTAITLYRLQRINERIGLVYAPSKEFNQEYSRGIGDYYEGAV